MVQELTSGDNAQFRAYHARVREAPPRPGLIAVLGGRIWVENKVDFKNPVNLFPAAIGLIMGAADLTWTHGDLSFNGIAIGSFGCILAYHLMNLVAKVGPTKGALYLPPVHETEAGDIDAVVD